MTDLHWIHGTLQREAARYPVTIHARFQDTYYSWLEVWKGSPAMTMTRGPKLALAWMDRPALAVMRAAEKDDRRERRATGRWPPVRRERYHHRVRAHCRRWCRRLQS